MLDNENRFDDLNNDNTDKPEDIFAEDDVVIPEEIHAEEEVKNPEDSIYRMRFERTTSDEAPKYDTPKYDTPPYQERRYSYMPEDETDEQTQKQGHKKGNGRKKGVNNYVKAIGCAVLCGVIIGGCILGSFAIGKNHIQPSQVAVSTNEAKLSVAAPAAGDADTTAGTYTVRQIAQECGTSVVAITNKSVSEVQTFFGTYQQESEGSGSGVIVSQTDAELLIATNYHVIENARELSVCFNDSEDAVYSAMVKGTDASNDLALISVPLAGIDAEVLNTISIATLGDSEQMQVGDPVVAIGNALGLGRSVTQGIVSALNKQVTIDATTYTLMQTDAAINPGNSGGALFNMDGELVGINSAKFASAQIEGMGFAIPMSKAQPIIENLMTKETKAKLNENYGCLNIKGSDVSADVSQMYGVPEGVYIAEVMDGGAAARAGLQEGDIITAIDGTNVTTIEMLREQLQYLPAGETVTLAYARNEGNGYIANEISVTLDNASEQLESNTQQNNMQQMIPDQGNQGFSQDGGFFFR